MERDNDCSICTASFCPSFSSYSADRLAETAERVSREVAGESDDSRREEDRVIKCGVDDEDGFEFVNLRTDPHAAAVASGDSGLIFPVFDQNLISDCYGVGSDGEDLVATVMTPLRDLFLRDRDDPPPPVPSSSSDDEDDELEGIPSEIYCPWTPARSIAEMSPSGGCRKSNSTGSSSTSTWSAKRWRIRDLLRRSRSDGKQSLVFINSNPAKSNGERVIREDESSKKEKKSKEKISAHERFYLRNKAMKEEDKRKSYLPYKQDLVGLFTNIGGYGKTFPPF
ncbi:PREDICTED: uncharacterized protein LOC104825335 [Tarenaya hassleriana]|uniref:uncharacterized protein LOC104825335 n=1 Tax=Tarenaya hassleriana TaxID=28532 RepID=UPI00053C1E27|nr:PREDICTED: uncharacterized protein LOC104825335 [Tarenaya hassleriana]